MVNSNRDPRCLCTPFDDTAVDFLRHRETPCHKIAPCENADLPLIRKVAATGKPVIVSTGMASEAEIEEAVTTAREADRKDLVLLHCISYYPAPRYQANLRQMPKLAKRFGTLPGFSDHTPDVSRMLTSARRHRFLDVD